MPLTFAIRIQHALAFGTILVLLMILTAQAKQAAAATGDFVHTTEFSESCVSGTGVGVAYDGSSLWYSCFEDGEIHRADALTGIVDYSYSTSGDGLYGVGAMAYDSGRNAIWLDGGDGNTYLVNLDSSMEVTNVALAFAHPEAGSGLFDGLAYDGSDDTLYMSYDGAAAIEHYQSDGTHLGSFAWAGDGCYNSGLAIGGALLYQGSDGCSHVWVVDKAEPSNLIFDYDTALVGDLEFRDEDLECDMNTFATDGKHVMWSMEAYEPRRAIAFEIPFDSCESDVIPPITSYKLRLFENSVEPTDGVVNLNQDVRAVAGTTDDAVTAVTFKWMKEGGDIAREITVPISNGEDTFPPDEPGDWLVTAEFDTGEIIVKRLKVDFFVLPESPIGVIAMILSSMGALGVFLFFKARKP